MSDVDKLEALMAPGERRIRREDKASEIAIPWGQYLRLTLAVLILFFGFSLILLIIGYWSLYGAGWLGVLVLFGISQRRVGGTRIVAAMVATMVAVFWFGQGVGLCRGAWIFATPDWHPMIKMWVIAGILVIICAPTAWVGYRYAVEIVDPSGPTAPRAASKRLTPVFPWTPEEQEASLGIGEIQALIEEALDQQPRELLRVEVVNGSDGDGRICAGGGITVDDLPVNRKALQMLVRGIAAGRCKWSRRDIANMPGIGDERARELLNAMVEWSFLHYPNGKNHPDGAVPTAKGRALMRGLLS